MFLAGIGFNLIYNSSQQKNEKKSDSSVYLPDYSGSG